MHLTVEVPFNHTEHRLKEKSNCQHCYCSQCTWLSRITILWLTMNSHKALIKTSESSWALIQEVTRGGPPSTSAFPLSFQNILDPDSDLVYSSVLCLIHHTRSLKSEMMGYDRIHSVKTLKKQSHIHSPWAFACKSPVCCDLLLFRYYPCFSAEVQSCQHLQVSQSFFSLNFTRSAGEFRHAQDLSLVPNSDTCDYKGSRSSKMFTKVPPACNHRACEVNIVL